jgi:uncharacterized protein YcbX
MSVVGHVESLWRYSVKSMRGEETQESFLGFPGVYGDRYYAFRDSAAPKGFPYLTARELQKLLLYRPSYRNPACAAHPPNLAEAQALAPGITPVYASREELSVDVETPARKKLSVDDPRLIGELSDGLREGHELTLVRSDRALTDCRPISLFSVQTARQLGAELGIELDKRRFRANVYIDLLSGEGFGEDKFVGSKLLIGEKAIIWVVDRDPRCKMITLDADTGEANPDVMKRVARFYGGKAGLYAAVLVEGTVRKGDEVAVLN